MSNHTKNAADAAGRIVGELTARDTTKKAKSSSRPARPEPPPVLTQRIPRCPRCRATHWRAYSTKSMGDDVKARYSKCTSCDLRVVLVVEPDDDEDGCFVTNNW